MKVKAPSTKWTGDKTPVIFRKWPKSEGGGVIALFPTIPGGYNGTFWSWEWVGQGGAANPGIIHRTRPACPEKDRAEIDRILEYLGASQHDIGRIVPCKRISPAMRDALRDALRSIGGPVVVDEWAQRVKIRRVGQ